MSLQDINAAERQLSIQAKLSAFPGNDTIDRYSDARDVSRNQATKTTKFGFTLFQARLRRPETGNGAQKRTGLTCDSEIDFIVFFTI
ncbi:hypothetical protein [Rhizobium aegyptiacum]|uniref:hypothetical protein n=1 Tax=Rhizobium aegyptiacum TaxID=1764550 RepID=UPI0007E5B7CF|nr:hypothetical protein [Rhizobium aegyptiacum]